MTFLLPFIVIGIATIVAVEIALLCLGRTGIAADMKASFKSISEARTVVSSSTMDDDEKQALMQAMTLRMLRSVGLFILVFVAVFLPFIVVYFVTPSYFTMLPLIFSTVLGIGYAWVRARNG